VWADEYDADDAAVKDNGIPSRVGILPPARHGVTTLWTRDRDFRKFEGIRTRDPFAETGR
jgi:hypothetical protein